MFLPPSPAWLLFPFSYLSVVFCSIPLNVNLVFFPYLHRWRHECYLDKHLYAIGIPTYKKLDYFVNLIFSVWITLDTQQCIKAKVQSTDCTWLTVFWLIFVIISSAACTHQSVLWKTVKHPSNSSLSLDSAHLHNRHFII